MKRVQKDFKILYHQRNVLKHGQDVLKMLPAVLTWMHFMGSKEALKLSQA